MKTITLLLITTIAAIFCGCASKPRDGATSKYAFDIPTKDGVRKVNIETPKDFEVDSIAFSAPSGESFQVHGLRSSVDRNAVQSAVINQQTQAQTLQGFVALTGKLADVAELAAQGYAKSQGVPIPQAQAPAPQPPSGVIPVPYVPTPTNVILWPNSVSDVGATKTP